MQFHGRVVSTGLTLLLVGIAGCDDAQLPGGGDRNADAQASTSVESSAPSAPLLFWSDPDMPPGDHQADLEDCQAQIKELGFDFKGTKMLEDLWYLECMAQKGWLQPAFLPGLTP